MAQLEHSKADLLTRAKSGHYYSFSDQIQGFGLFHDHNSYTMIEKRLVFLRSYQFSRKKSLSERLKRSWVRVKRVICLRLRSARRLRRRFSCFRLRCGGLSHRRRRFVRLLSNKSIAYDSNCFW